MTWPQMCKISTEKLKFTVNSTTRRHPVHVGEYFFVLRGYYYKSVSQLNSYLPEFECNKDLGDVLSRRPILRGNEAVDDVLWSLRNCNLHEAE